jgi:hypothetical protein
MLHHIELYVSDLERAISFWTPFMERLGYDAERWSGGMNYFAGEQDPYLCLLPAPVEHLTAGYHRKRVGLNHLAFRARSRGHVDEMRHWIEREGYTYPAMLMEGGLPNFFTINGKAYPDTERISMRVGERVRIRFIGTTLPPDVVGYSSDLDLLNILTTSKTKMSRKRKNLRNLATKIWPYGAMLKPSE